MGRSILPRWLPVHEAALAAAIAVLAIAIGLRSPSFLTVANLFDLLRSATVPGLLAMGVLVVLVSGGIDVSFAAIAIFSLTASVELSAAAGLGGPWPVPLATCALIGLGLGLVNAALVAGLGLPTLIATLGTGSVFRGVLLFAIASELTRDLPEGMIGFAGARLAAVAAPGGGQTSLHPAVLVLAGAALVAAVLLRWTLLGRAIHAIGGSAEAAARIGLPVARIRTFVFGFAGALAGIAGFIHGCLFRQANPFDLVGSELDVIAAVVLGGASIEGGRGTVAGTLLGVLLITIVNNSLILVGVPTEWQKVFIGAAIIAGTAIPACRAAAARGPAARPEGDR